MLIIDYPSNTVPNKVAQLFQAQLFHDRKQRWTRSQAAAKGEELPPAIDYLRPMVADADTGHGGWFHHVVDRALTDIRFDCRHEAHEDDGRSWCRWYPYRRSGSRNQEVRTHGWKG